jgi:hypothetical protein
VADPDRTLREMYAGATTPASDGHPSDETWERLAMNELASAEREAVMDHVVRCADCAGLYRGLRELETGARAFDSGVPSRAAAGAGPRRIAPAFLAGLAAAAVLIVALIVPRLMTPPPSEDGVRSAPVTAPVPLQPIGDVAGRPEQLTWQPFPGADRYRVEIFTGDGTGSWTSEPVAETHLVWPADFPARPGVYYWKVTALAGADRRVASDVPSRLVMFAIVAR